MKVKIRGWIKPGSSKNPKNLYAMFGNSKLWITRLLKYSVIHQFSPGACTKLVITGNFNLISNTSISLSTRLQ